MPHTSGLPDVTPESVRWPVPSCPPHVVPEQAVTLKRQRPQPLEPRSGSGVQGARPRPRLATDPRHHPRPGQAVQPRSARAQAQPGLPAGRAVSRPPRAPSPPPAPTAHPREEGRAARARQALNFPLAPPGPGSSPAARCMAWRAGAGLVPASEPSRNFDQVGGPRAQGRPRRQRRPNVQSTL